MQQVTVDIAIVTQMVDVFQIHLLLLYQNN